MKAADTSVELQGATRCCLATLVNYALRGEYDLPEGLFVPCEYERNGAGMRLTDGMWIPEWEPKK